jgi:hypothetical protein
MKVVAASPTLVLHLRGINDTVIRVQVFHTVTGSDLFCFFFLVKVSEYLSSRGLYSEPSLKFSPITAPRQEHTISILTQPESIALLHQLFKTLLTCTSPSSSNNGQLPHHGLFSGPRPRPGH